MDSSRLFKDIFNLRTMTYNQLFQAMYNGTGHSTNKLQPTASFFLFILLLLVTHYVAPHWFSHLVNKDIVTVTHSCTFKLHFVWFSFTFASPLLCSITHTTSKLWVGPQPQTVHWRDPDYTSLMEHFLLFWGNTSLSSAHLTCGVPQGSILDHIFSNDYIYFLYITLACTAVCTHTKPVTPAA